MLVHGSTDFGRGAGGAPESLTDSYLPISASTPKVVVPRNRSAGSARRRKRKLRSTTRSQASSTAPTFAPSRQTLGAFLDMWIEGVRTELALTAWKSYADIICRWIKRAPRSQAARRADSGGRQGVARNAARPRRTQRPPALSTISAVRAPSGTELSPTPYVGTSSQPTRRAAPELLEPTHRS